MNHLTDTHRTIPVTPDMRGLSRWITQRRNRLRSKHRALAIRTHHTDLDAAAAWLLTDYTRAVKDGADRHELSAILTGISGCLLAGSACWYAQGWSDKAERDRLSGLLLAEVAACASENPSRADPPPYQGPRAPEFQGQEITDALNELALAYQDPPDDDEFVVWGCLSALIDTVIPITEGAWSGLEILADMSDAHFAVEHPAQEPDVGRPLEQIQRDADRLDRWFEYYKRSPILLAALFVSSIVVWIAAGQTAGQVMLFGATCGLVIVLTVIGSLLVWRLGKLSDERRRALRPSEVDAGGLT